MPLRVAVFGQAAFGKDVLVRLLEAGHQVVGVYAPPEGGRPDPLAAEASERGLPLFRHKRFRRKGEAIPELVKEHAELGADLNVLAYVTAILPVEILDAPREQSICFHPSLLPAYRGGAAIPWQIILGAKEVGVSVFRPDEGVDTGPVVVQVGGVEIAPTDNAASLYFDKLYPLGVDAMATAVERIASGDASFTAQPEAGASHQGLIGDDESRIDWGRPAAELDRLIRGCDPQPGAWAELAGQRVRCFGATLETAPSGSEAPGTVLEIGPSGARVAAREGSLRLAKLLIGEAAKLPAAEAAISPGDRLV
jgi:methionyl-tRNA formyltransferase